MSKTAAVNNGTKNRVSATASGRGGGSFLEEFTPLDALLNVREDDNIISGDLVKRVKEEEARARQQCREMIRKAEAEAGNIEKKAYLKGYAKGEQEGKLAGQKEFDELIDHGAQLLQEIREQRLAVNKQYEREMLVIIQAMVNRLTNHEVSVNPLVIKSCLKRALDFVVENSLVKVRLHSDDYHRIKEASLEDASLLQGKSRVQLIEDPNVSLGGCFLETDFGEVDATLENCRDKLYEAVDKAFMAAWSEDLPED